LIVLLNALPNISASPLLVDGSGQRSAGKKHAFVRYRD